MFKRIFVPLDGSMRAEQALPVAARIARARGATIVLLRVITTPFDFVWYSSRVPPIASPEALEEEHTRATSYVTHIATSDVLDGIGVVSVVVGGGAAEMILSVARTQEADLIVMSRHGQTGAKRWLLGSVAQKVARHSSCPVLLVREEPEGAEVSRGLLSKEGRTIRVMVALDGSRLAEEALSPALALTEALSAPLPGALHLVQVLPPISEDGLPLLITSSQAGDFYPAQLSSLIILQDELPGEQQAARLTRKIEEAKAYLRKIVQRLHTGKDANPLLSITSSVMVDPDCADALIDSATGSKGIGVEAGERGIECDVIALATHGRGGLARWLMGSVAERLLSETRLPLLIVRPQPVHDEHKAVERVGTQAVETTRP